MSDITTDFILNAAERLEEFYAQRNSNMLVWRELALLVDDSYWIDENGQYSPPEDKEVRIVLPIANSVIQSYQSLMLTRPPVISVPASSILEMHQEQTDKIEKTLYAIWYKADVMRAIRNSLWHALVDGWGVLQIHFDPSADLKDKCPLFARSVDPLGVYPMPSQRPGQWEYMITVEHRLVGDLRKSFILGKDGRTKAVKLAKGTLEGMEDTDRIRVLEYWDEEVHAFMIIPVTTESMEEPEVQVGKWLLPPTPHKFKKIPFVVFFGDELPFNNRGERMGVSVLFPIERLIRYLCQLVSQKATIIARYADPTLVTKTLEGRGFEAPEPFGGQIPLELDESAAYLIPPGTSPSVDVQLDLISSQLEQAGLPRHIMGQLTVGKLSGIAMNLLRTPVLMKIAFKQMSMETALETMNELFLRAIEEYLTSPMYMWGRTPQGDSIEAVLDPADIQGYYRNRVKLTASLPTDETAVTAMLTALKQIGVLSGRTVRNIIQQVLRDLTTQSLKDEEDQILIETLMSMPEIQMALAQDAAQSAGIQLPQQGQQQGPGGAQAPMQGAIPGFGGGAMAPQGMPWKMQGRQTPTTPDMMRRLARQTPGAAGGRPTESLGMPTSPGTVMPVS